MPDGLRLVVDADTSSAEKALNNFQKSIEKFGGGIKPFTANVEALNNVIGTKLPTALGKASTALNKLPNTSNQATFALGNLGRVAQDAPFGFLGIANNLNPLLESLQRLKATSGSTGGALKALGSSLAGAGGLGFALSVASSLLIVFGDKLFGAGKAAKAANDSIAALADSTAQDAAKLTVLVGLATNVAASTEDREKALKALNQEYKTYIQNLGIEEISLKNINEAYGLIINSMLKQAVVKGLQEQIANEVKKTAAEIIRLKIAEETLAQEQENKKERQKKLLEDQSRLIRADSIQTRAVTDGALAQADHNAEMKEGIKTGISIQSRIDGLTQSLIKQLSPLLKITDSFADLGIKLDGLKPPPKLSTGLEGDLQFFKLIGDALKKIHEASLQIIIPKQQRRFDIGADIRIDPTSVEFDKATADRKISKALTDEISRLTKDNVILQTKIEPTVDEKRLAQTSENISNILNQAVTEGFSSIGEGLGEVLSGGSLEKAFAGFASTIGTAVQEIGKQLIALGTTALAAKIALNSLFANPALAIAAGVALVAIGAAMKNLLSGGVKGFAEGGLVFGPTVGLVGEGSGTSRSNPEVIAPLDKLKGMMSGRGRNGDRVKVRGQFLILPIERARQANQRGGFN